jgi:hypothetical protein
MGLYPLAPLLVLLKHIFTPINAYQFLHAWCRIVDLFHRPSTGIVVVNLGAVRFEQQGPEQYSAIALLELSSISRFDQQ